MNDGQPVAHMRVRVAFGRFAMRCPARVTNAYAAEKRFLRETLRQVFQLATDAPASQVAYFQSCYSSSIISAIFEPSQRLKNAPGDWTLT
jgi:hypothetical protein